MDDSDDDDKDPFVRAIDNGNIAEVQSIINDYSASYLRHQFQCEVDEYDDDGNGRTLLCRAAKNGHLEIVRLFLDNGANVNFYGRIDHIMGSRANFPGALALACEGGHLETVHLLLDRGANINRKDCDGYTPLHRTACGGNVNIVRLLLDQGANYDRGNCYQRDSPETCAVRYGQFRMVQFFLSEKKNVCKYLASRDKDDGSTLLTEAAEHDNASIVQLLLDEGANIHSRDNEGRTPLLLAARRQKWENVRLLLERGADIEDQSSSKFEYGKTALSYACVYYSKPEDLQMTRFLLDRHANIEHQCSDGFTPLLLAISRAKKEVVVQLLLDRGAYIEHQDENGMTPLLVSIEENWSVTKLLLDHGANINHQNNNGDSALHLVTASATRWAYGSENTGYLKLIQLLLERGANIDLQNKDGMLPLDSILLHNRDETLQIVHLLVQHAAVRPETSSHTMSCIMSRLQQTVLTPRRVTARRAHRKRKRKR